MKALLEKLPATERSSFKLYNFNFPYFPTPWHFHPEYELVLVVKSHGQRIIGNGIGDFTDGDLVFIGANVPHIYRNDSVFYQQSADHRAESVIVHFLEDFLGEPFMELQEMIPIRQLFQRAALGLEILGPTKDYVIARMMEMSQQEGMRRLLLLLDILTTLAESSHLRALSTQIIEGSNPVESEKVSLVFDYISQHYQRRIALREIADLMNMSVPSVCRFIKRRTHKTLINLINELRISHACKLLTDTNLSIIEICYDCGFQNLSNFNRQFRLLKNSNPQTFRKQLWNSNPQE
ncbi:AraC family transcriptional regulator [Spirosoma endbachense]|uniref:Helix-turn-helix domain-containing protein n=1 Tax=Spirosoma endbachense TaxID=2666025 RepID=A0A6P1W535_9BACT|nr:AraC family transcriptional regulator [Spirosoma endbachense]QHW00136.1 helix-turn-helix domain-containing protein [Spirosoma endbachense]